jgi:2-methylcitrate dehydratase PrpD
MQAFTEEKVKDRAIKDFMGKITVNKTADFQALEAKVEIETDAGKSYSAVSDILKTIPELEEKKSKISAKFLDLCTPVLGSQASAALGTAVDSLETIDNMQMFVGAAQKK